MRETLHVLVLNTFFDIVTHEIFSGIGLCKKGNLYTSKTFIDTNKKQHRKRKNTLPSAVSRKTIVFCICVTPGRINFRC